MNKRVFKLNPGVTPACLLDAFEETVVKYMQERRGIDEQAMRTLLDKDAEVRASYRRKIQRAIDQAVSQGVPASIFKHAA